LSDLARPALIDASLDSSKDLAFLTRFGVAELVAGLRKGMPAGDLLGRVQLLLLALALLSAAGASVAVLTSGKALLALRLAAIVAGTAMAAAWIRAYRLRSFGFAADAVTIGGVALLVAAAAADGWSGMDAAVLAVAVFFSSTYGSLPRVLARTSLLCAIGLGLGLSEPASLTTACVLVIGFLITAGLIHGLVASIARYEATTRREHILAATGLDLVVAADLPEIAASAVEGAHSLCSTLRGVRVSLAMVKDPEHRPACLEVLSAAGERAGEWLGAEIDLSGLAPSGRKPSSQRLLRAGEVELQGAIPDASSEGRASDARRLPFLDGDVLLTGVSVNNAARAVLIVESPQPILGDLPAAIRALATQVSLAISRTDLQKDAIERKGTERFQALVQASSDVISIVSPDGLVRFQSPAVRQVFGYDADEVVGTDVAQFVHPEDEASFAVGFKEVAAHPGASIVCECRIHHADGTWRHTETRMTNLVDVAAIGGVVLNSRDVTERHNLEDELRHQAFHDPLTGLANRALFANRIEHALAYAKRDGSTVAVLYCDLDGFKRLNDSLGYSAGDTALNMVAERLTSCVRGQDTVARLGGDEFGLLLDRLSSPADATMALDRIMAALRQPLALPGAQVEIQPRIGIAVSIAGQDTTENLLRNSAVAMHQARHFDGGYAVFDPEMHADAIRRLEVESQLRTALEKSQFTLHYQPTIDLQTGRVTGVEALVRWQRPQYGLVPPKEFIPLAEESGLIVPLGQWTIKESCRQVRVWQKEIPADEAISLSVNLSARQLRHPNVVSDVAETLEATGLLPSRLILEITESDLMTDAASTLNRLFQLKSLGVRLAVDDFGTGYSAFAYLRRFPIDILKIDKSFVDGIATEPTASALVDTMIQIGKTLNLETIAEGVEHVEQADRLRELKCDVAQGFLFSRPLAPDGLTEFLREHSVGHQAHAA
jgi:diguanylate cyclase (GGDEF)-like protein/PAS domain S-box-containing protein